MLETALNLQSIKEILHEITLFVNIVLISRTRSQQFFRNIKGKYLHVTQMLPLSKAEMFQIQVEEAPTRKQTSPWVSEGYLGAAPCATKPSRSCAGTETSLSSPRGS